MHPEQVKMSQPQQLVSQSFFIAIGYRFNERYQVIYSFMLALYGVFLACY